MSYIGLERFAQRVLKITHIKPPCMSAARDKTKSTENTPYYMTQVKAEEMSELPKPCCCGKEKAQRDLSPLHRLAPNQSTRKNIRIPL